MEDAFPFTYQNKWRCHHFQHFYNFYLLFTRIIDCVVKPNMSLLRVFDGRLSFDIVAEGKKWYFYTTARGKNKTSFFFDYQYTTQCAFFLFSLSVLKMLCVIIFYVPNSLRQSSSQLQQDNASHRILMMGDKNYVWSRDYVVVTSFARCFIFRQTRPFFFLKDKKN